MPDPNLEIDIVHYRTGEVIETQRIYEPTLGWRWVKGEWQLLNCWGCGRRADDAGLWPVWQCTSCPNRFGGVEDDPWEEA